MRLRDIDLRCDSAAPESFWKRGPVEYTFPVFDYAIESVDSLQWESSTTLSATFKTFGANDHRVFGRRNYDSDGFVDVSAVDSADRRRRSFTVDVSSLTKQN